MYIAIGILLLSAVIMFIGIRKALLVSKFVKAVKLDKHTHIISYGKKLLKIEKKKHLRNEELITYFSSEMAKVFLLRGEMELFHESLSEMKSYKDFELKIFWLGVSYLLDSDIEMAEKQYNIMLNQSPYLKLFRELGNFKKGGANLSEAMQIAGNLNEKILLHMLQQAQQTTNSTPEVKCGDDDKKP